MIYYKNILSPVGNLCLVANEVGLIQIRESHVANENPNKITQLVEDQLQEYFLGQRSSFDVPLELTGTDFQKETWHELLKIPYGKVISYKQQSEKMNKPKAIRAVAAANGKNPIPIIVPCHRVIASNQQLHGYAGGLDMKKKLLEIEGLKLNGYRLET